METVYSNNSVDIQLERAPMYEPWWGGTPEYKVNVNGDNLIWISGEEKEAFIRELVAVLDKYRI